MKHKHNYLIATAIALFTAGCATNGEHAFVPSTSPVAATVRGQVLTESTFVWEKYRFISIDNKPVRDGLIFRTLDDVLPLNSGKHTFVVGASFNRGHIAGHYEAIIPISAELEPNKNYQLKGVVTGNRVRVWLEDLQSGLAVSEKISPPIN